MAGTSMHDSSSLKTAGSRSIDSEQETHSGDNLNSRRLQEEESLPNDPKFYNQWGMHNSQHPGQDVSAPEAWALLESEPNSGSASEPIVVAVIDSGVNYDHPDLKDRMWRNPGEIPGNGIDDDGNGYIDDVHGIDLVSCYKNNIVIALKNWKMTIYLKR